MPSSSQSYLDYHLIFNPRTLLHRFSLENGLRVVLDYDPTQAMAVVDVLYNVGSRDEYAGHTGMAHLFEHLMFGGSANIADFDGELTRAGGQSNAWTSTDYTNFFDILPAANIETALWLESDRMLSLAFAEKPLEVQRQVVVEEFKQVCLNRPYGDSEHLLRAMCYDSHPYRTPVIGKEFAHIEQVTQDDVRHWFAAHYAPNNAVLSVAGNVTPERLYALVQKWFGQIPTRQIAPRLYSDEPEPDGERLTEASGNVPQTAITMAFPMAAYGAPGFAAADAVSDILANGRSSRFYRRQLRPDNVFSDLDASILGSDHPGLFLISARLLENGPQAEARAMEAIREELAEIASHAPASRELERVKNTVESDRTFSLLPLQPRAEAYALAEIHGHDPAEPLRRYRSLTPEEVRSSAAALFAPGRGRTLIYRPRS